MKKILLITSMLVCVSNPTLAITREECFERLTKMGGDPALTFQGPPLHERVVLCEELPNEHLRGYWFIPDLGGTCEIVPDGGHASLPGSTCDEYTRVMHWPQ